MNLREIFSYLFDYGKDVLNSVIDASNGVVQLQTGDATRTSKVVASDADRVEQWCAGPGFVSLPAPPTAGQPSAQVVVIKRGDRDLAIGARDTRAAQVYGNLVAGEATAFAAVGSARTVWKANGTIAQIVTDDNTATGNSTFTRLNGSEWRFQSMFGSQWHDATGFHVRAQGAKLDVGPSGLPAPFSAFGSVAALTADVIQLNASVLALGRDTGNMQAAVLATSLQAVMTLLATAVTDLQTAIAAVNAAAATSTGYGAGGTAALATAAIAASGTASSAATTALGTITTVCSSVTSIA